MSPGTTVRERIGPKVPGRLSGRLDLKVIADLDRPGAWSGWSALEAEAAGTAYQARAFVEPLTRRLAPALGRSAFLIEIHDEAGPLLAAALVMRRWYGARIIEFADFGYVDCCGPLVRRGLEADPEAIGRLDAALQAGLPRHDALILKRMPAEIAGEANPFALLPGARPMGCGTFELPPGSRISGSSATIRNSERKARRLVRDGGTVRRITDPAEALAALELAFAWRSGSGDRYDWAASPLAHPAARDFYREVIGQGVASGHSVLHQVATAQAPIGLVHGFVHAGRYHGSLMAVDRTAPDARLYSPGMVGVLAAIGDHLARETGGVDLGAGNSEYKRHFRGRFRHHIMVARARTPLGALAVARAKLHDAGRHWMRAHPALARQIRAWRGL